MKSLFMITGKVVAIAIVLTASCIVMVFAKDVKNNDFDLLTNDQMNVWTLKASSVEWTALDANTTVKTNGSEVEVSRLHPAGYNTGMQYLYIARATLAKELSNDGNSVTIEFKIKGWLDWARIALTFGNTTASYLNPPFFIQNDGKTNFNWTASATPLDPDKWYKVTIVMNPTKAAWVAGEISYSYEVRDIEKDVVFTSGTKTPAANETITVIPQTIKYINWANRTSVQPTADTYWTITFKDFMIYQSIPVSVIQHPVKTKMDFYPNPVKDILHIKNVTAGAKLYIYDMQGCLCIEELLTDMTIDVSKLSKGAYIIKIVEDGVTQSSNFIK
ncbi:MAG: T9SS type A sorting domain-containing protein [Prolixibacteraceae bacterium]|nr:T9SS type A sorting domain-containing protein [Prolixibacteraceae bacterium]